MLELRRKVGQDVYIVVPGREKPMRISVMGIIEDSGHGREVRLAFHAESDIEILRHELYEARNK